ncbi:MAG: sulfite exporter TauE/SafE family protein [Provencibacterium sp.]|nr:sulfite exporter TauE/SafE family protein [Provencibacterium sp.]
MQWLSALLPAFLSAVLGALGMGGGGVLLIYLSVFRQMEQMQAQGINLAFFLPVAAVSLIFHIKNRLVDFKLCALLIPAGLAGAYLGVLLAGSLPETLLRRLFAAFLLLIGLKELWSAFRAFREPRENAAGKREK